MVGQMDTLGVIIQFRTNHPANLMQQQQQQKIQSVAKAVNVAMGEWGRHWGPYALGHREKY